MGFGTAISTGFTKYFNFSDRACRSEYWYWTLFTVIVGGVAAIIDAKLDTELVSGLVNLAILVPSLAIAVRRLHDLDEPGWWILLGLIPIIGGIALLIWFVLKGTDGSNRFGPDPLAAKPPLADQQFGTAA
jgi:uncharacterized membrane protein YhaH (DUF805 family)